MDSNLYALKKQVSPTRPKKGVLLQELLGLKPVLGTTCETQ